MVAAAFAGSVPSIEPPGEQDSSDRREVSPERHRVDVPGLPAARPEGIHHRTGGDARREAPKDPPVAGVRLKSEGGEEGPDVREAVRFPNAEFGERVPSELILHDRGMNVDRREATEVALASK